MKSTFAALLFIFVLFTLSHAETSYKFFQLEDEPIYYSIIVDSDAIATITINDKISLITQPGAYLGQGESRNLYAKLSEDKNKLIVFLGIFLLKMHGL